MSGHDEVTQHYPHQAVSQTDTLTISRKKGAVALSNGKSRRRAADCPVRHTGVNGNTPTKVTEDKKMKGKQQLTDEGILDEGIKKILRKGPQDFSPENWKAVKESLRLKVLYPGMYVVHWDEWMGEGDTLRLVERKVLRAFPKEDEARDYFDETIKNTAIPQQRHLGLTFVEVAQRSGQPCQAK
jgi:hypothetical protein